jgi:hypothetical protein
MNQHLAGECACRVRALDVEGGRADATVTLVDFSISSGPSFQSGSMRSYIGYSVSPRLGWIGEELVYFLAAVAIVRL